MTLIPIAELPLHFPKASILHFDVASPETASYNCIAWAAGDDTKWWWPGSMYYWPHGGHLQPSVEVFTAAFATLGYSPAFDGLLEIGLEKVVIYCSGANVTHMARQEANGVWMSKLGRSYDVMHLLPQCVENATYGQAQHFLSRPRLT